MITPQAIVATIKINLQRHPLWPVETVRECLGLKRYQVIELIESGRLKFAWNVGFGESRKEIRVLGLCAVEAQSGPISGIGSTRSLELPEVLQLLLPHVRETMRGTELQRILWVEADTIRKYREHGELKWVREKLPAKGINSSPRFTRDSVAMFLQRRILK